MVTERVGHPGIAVVETPPPVATYVGEEKSSEPGADGSTWRKFKYDVPRVGQLELQLTTMPDSLATDMEEGAVLTPVGGVDLPTTQNDDTPSKPKQTPYFLDVTVSCVNTTVRDSLQLALVLEDKRYRGVPDKDIVGTDVYFHKWVDEAKKRGPIYLPEYFDPSQVDIEYSIDPSRIGTEE